MGEDGTITMKRRSPETEPRSDHPRIACCRNLEVRDSEPQATQRRDPAAARLAIRPRRHRTADRGDQLVGSSVQERSARADLTSCLQRAITRASDNQARRTKAPWRGGPVDGQSPAEAGRRPSPDPGTVRPGRTRDDTSPPKRELGRTPVITENKLGRRSAKSWQATARNSVCRFWNAETHVVPPSGV